MRRVGASGGIRRGKLRAAGRCPAALLITIHTIMSHALRMPAASNVSSAAAITFALAADRISSNTADSNASRYPRSGSNT